MSPYYCHCEEAQPTKQSPSKVRTHAGDCFASLALTRVFLYGTLLDRTTLAARSGDLALAARTAHAALAGWRRVALRGTRYPTLRRHRATRVCGVIVDVPARALARLAAYEGPRYRLRRVVVQTTKRKSPAFAWIASAGTRRNWKE